MNKPAGEPGRAVSLTEHKVASVKPRDRRWILADASVPGLVVRIEPSGAKSYFVRSRIGRGRNARWAEIRVGSAGLLRLAEARQQARQLLADMRTGNDPRIPAIGALAVGDLISRYAARLEQRSVVKQKDVIRSLRQNLNNFVKKSVGEMTRAEIVSILDAIESDGRPGAAQDFRKHVVAMLNWSVGAGLLMASPMAGYRRERSTRAQKLSRPKPVFTSDDEIRRFWVATAGLKNPNFSAFLRFLLLTGQRRTETALMRFADIVGEAGDVDWNIPMEIRKMGDTHRVPLAAASLAIIQSRPKTSSGLIFPGRHGVPMSGWSKRLKPLKKELDLPVFGFHTLRRTYRTGLSELEVPNDIAEMMIGHAKPELVRRYDKASLWRQRRAAQEKWESYISEVVR